MGGDTKTAAVWLAAAASSHPWVRVKPQWKVLLGLGMNLYVSLQRDWF